MPIAKIHDQTVLFLHIPKTGGSSIERHLESVGELGLIGGCHRQQGLPCSPQHLHAAAIKKLFPERTFDWAFMVVRHPVERTISQYKYQIRKTGGMKVKLPFSLWLRYVFGRQRISPHYRDNHFLPQHLYEGFSADVFHFENGIDSCIATINRKFDLAPPTIAPWEKHSEPISLDVSKADLELIRSFYREDFNRYGYT